MRNWLRRLKRIKPLEVEAIKKEAGDNGFVMTPKRWIESTGEEILEAIGFQEQYFMGELYTL